MNDIASQDRGRRTNSEEYTGETPAPATGSYEQLNIFGRATGHRVAVAKGEALPPLPRGFSWRLVKTD